MAINKHQHIIWAYNDWDGKYLLIGGDERYRRTLVIRLPFTTRAIVLAISRPGALYDPDCRDETFERWQRAFQQTGT